MCGVPYHAAASYIARLVKDGHKVAICEQTTAPQDAKGIVERAVVKVITPGVALDDELLDPKSNNFIASACLNGSRAGFAYMDVSTGEFRATLLSSLSAVNEEIKRIRPLELLVHEGAGVSFENAEVHLRKVTPLPECEFDFASAVERLSTQFGTRSLDGFGLSELSDGVEPQGRALAYVKESAERRARTSRVHRSIRKTTSSWTPPPGGTSDNRKFGEAEGAALMTTRRDADRYGTAPGSAHPPAKIAPIRDSGAVSNSGQKGRARPSGRLSMLYISRLSGRASLGVRARGPRGLKGLAQVVPELMTRSRFNGALLKDVSRRAGRSA